MSELQHRLEKLVLRLDYMGMRVEQIVLDSLEALDKTDVHAADEVIANDEAIDSEEVQIEQECIRLLALYQPAAVDLRTICTIIKVNSDLERIADLAVTIGKQVKHAFSNQVDILQYDGLDRLKSQALESLGRAVRMLAANDMATAKKIIEFDTKIDESYKKLVGEVLSRNETAVVSITMINIARALERIGDLCSNIAEDIIFLRTGDIVRHSSD